MEFIEIVKKMGTEKILEIQKGFLEALSSAEKMQKQALAASLVMTADKIVTEHIFMDGCYISLEEVGEVLIERNELSDNERCYEYVMDVIAMNPVKFDEDTEKTDRWGHLDGEYVYLIPAILERICEERKFSKKSFLRWACENGKAKHNPGRTGFNKRFWGKVRKCYALKLQNDELECDDFVSVPSVADVDLPFS